MRFAHLLLPLATILPALLAHADEPIEFSRDIRPILIEHCYQCHGPDEAHRQAGLRLDIADAAKSRLPSRRTAVVPGRLDSSEIWWRITHADPKERMPPSEGKPLDKRQKGLLKRWIDAGADWPEHWAFRSPKRPLLPQLPVELRTWPRGPIDSLVAQRLIAESLRPSPPADRLTLLRRVSLDLAGILPSLEEIEVYSADKSPDAYERTVDRLLASPCYGERMASDWLDAARYADTHGYHSDSQRDMWRWRDWVIDAFNANIPFDRFTIEQLAGDLLPEPTLVQRIATGFNRNHMLNDENGAIPEEYRCEYVSDRVTTTATIWLGLTVACARCHDHKYDPLPQRDFYRLFAFFNSVPENGLGGRSGNVPPLVLAPTRLQQAELELLAMEIAELDTKLARRAAAAGTDQTYWERAALQEADGLKRPPQDAILQLPLDDQPPADQGAEWNIKGNATFLETKERGRVLLCDGETSGEVPRSRLRGELGLERTDSFSLSVWIYATTGDRAGLISATDETLEGRGLELALIEERLTVRLTHLPESDELLFRTRGRLPRNQWQHIVVAYDGSGQAAGARIYVGGQSQPLETIHNTLRNHIATDQPIRIGRTIGDTIFRGMLDDVRIFSRAISSAEAALLAGGNPIHDLLRIEPQARTAEQREAVRKYYLENRDSTYQELLARQTVLKVRQQKVRQAAPTVMVMEDLPSPRATFVLGRGRYDQPEEQVTPGTPEILPPLPAEYPRNRLGLAKWLVHPEQPLTARVTVNRFWQSLFGTGLVKTADDFGVRGEPPSHPDLLDWLAVDFADGDVKRFFRRVVTSATYRQSSRVTPELVARDEANRLLARGPRVRLSAEAIRDSALSAAGLLDTRIGGPGVRPYQPADLWKELAYDPLEYTAQTYRQSQGADLYRRGLYTFRKRTVPPPSLAIFDANDREVCAVTNSRTSTPLQALVLWNDPTYVEAARHLAQRAMRDAAADAERLERIFWLVLTRSPQQEEAAVLLAQLASERREFSADPKAAQALLAVGESPPDLRIAAEELAAWTTIASVVLNLDEAITNH